jgi:two-component system sensor kinase FixL
MAFVHEEDGSPFDRPAVSATAQRIMGAGVWQYDTVSGQGTWSEQVFKLFGLARDRNPISFDDLALLFGKAGTEFFCDQLRRVLDDGTPIDFEGRVAHPGGEERCLRVRGEMSQLQSGRIIGTVQDVTAEKRAYEIIQRQSEELEAVKEKLRSENNRFRSLFDQAPVFLALGSTPEMRFEYANQAYLALVGNRPVVGKTVAEALPEVLAQGLVAVLTSVYETGQPYIAVEEPTQLYNRPDGSTEQRFLTYIYQPLRDAHNLITGIICIGYDVTDQYVARAEAEKLREELFQASRMAAMGTMAGTLAHELNQPLTALTMYASGLLRHLGPGADVLLAEAIAALQSEALRAGEIMRRMKDIAAGRSTQREPFDLNSLLTAAGNLPSVSCEGVSLEFLLKHTGLAYGDPIQIQQVVTNLLRNACDAMAGRRDKKISIATEEKDQQVIIRISDTGPGVEPELLPKLFEAKESSKKGGMGIGLPICRTIIEAHKGRIGYEAGTSPTFWFTLPRCQV